MSGCWVFVTEQKLAAEMVACVRTLSGPITAVVVGPPTLADAVAALGVTEVRWVEPAADVPVEAYARGLAEVVGAGAPQVLVAAPEPSARALLGAAAARLGAVLIPGLLDVSAEPGGDEVVVRRAAIGGEVIETLVTAQPVAGVFGGPSTGGSSGEAPAEWGSSGAEAAGSGAEVGGSAAEVAGAGIDVVGTGNEVVPAGGAGAAREALRIDRADMRVAGAEPAAATTGLNDASHVVGVGRGVRAREDLALIERLATALGAEIGCTMPVADDLRWLDQARYIGRSGQHIAPRLYLAVGIGGAPQHMEGVRDAKVVAAVNNDPDARVFKAADYGIVGDLYEVVPALIEALQHEGGGA